MVIIAFREMDRDDTAKLLPIHNGFQRHNLTKNQAQT